MSSTNPTGRVRRSNASIRLLLKFPAPPNEDALASDREWVVMLARARRIQIEHPYSMGVIKSLVDKMYRHFWSSDPVGARVP